MTDMATRKRLRCCTAACSLVITAAAVSGMVLTWGVRPATAAPVVPVQDGEGVGPDGAEEDDGAGAADAGGSGSPVAPLVVGGVALAGVVVGGGLLLGQRRRGADVVTAPVGELPPAARAVPLQVAHPAVPVAPADPAAPVAPADSGPEVDVAEGVAAPTASPAFGRAPEPLARPAMAEATAGSRPADVGDGASVLDVAFGVLRGAGGRAGLPPINRLEVTQDTVDVVLADPADPPAGFTAAGPNRWRADGGPVRPGTVGDGAAAPVAALAPVGVTVDGAEVLVDLEASGLVVVDGTASEVAALLRGLVPAIVSAPWPERPEVLLVGIGGTVIDREGVGAVATLTEALDRAEVHAHRTRVALEGIGASRLGEARAAGAGGEAWTTLVVVSGERPVDMDDRRRLRDLALRRNGGVAFVTPPPASGILPGRRFSVRDRRLLVDGFDEPVRPRLVSEEESGGTVTVDVEAGLGGLRSDDHPQVPHGPVLAQDDSAGDHAAVPTPLAGLPVKVPENAAPTLDEPTPPALLGSPAPKPSSGPVEGGPVDLSSPLDPLEPVREPAATNGGSDPGVEIPTLEMDPPDGRSGLSERDVVRKSDIVRSPQVFAAREDGPSEAAPRRPGERPVRERQVDDLPGPATKPVPVVMFDTHDDGPLPPPPPEPRTPAPSVPSADPSGRSPFAPPTPGGAGVPRPDGHRDHGAGPDGDAGRLLEKVAVLVRVLGHVEVARIAPERHEEPLTPPRPKALEAVVYLALRENGADREALEIRLFPDGANVPKTMYNTISAARALLGEDLFPPPVAGRYRLGDEVATDFGLFRELVAEADVTDDPAEVAGALGDALRLVRGEPFMGPGRNYAWAGPHRNMIVADVVDAAERLAEIHMARGSWQAAEWAARQGLRAFPQDERLYRLLMRSAAGSGNGDAVRRVYNELCTLLREPGEELDPTTALHPETLSLLAELTA